MLAYLHTMKWQAFTQTDLQAIDAVAAQSMTARDLMQVCI